MYILLRIYFVYCWLFDFFPTTNPFTSSFSWKFRIFHWTSLKCIFGAIYPLIINVDQAIAQHMQKKGFHERAQKNSLPLAVVVMYYTTFLTNDIVNFGFRLSICSHCPSLINIIQFLVRVKPILRKSNTQSLYLRYGFLTLFIFIISNLYVFYFLIKDLVLSKEFVVPKYLHTIPWESVAIAKLALFYGNIYSFMAPVFAISMMWIIGLYLLEIHRDMCYLLCTKIFEDFLTRKGNSSEISTHCSSYSDFKEYLSQLFNFSTDFKRKEKKTVKNGWTNDSAYFPKNYNPNSFKKCTVNKSIELLYKGKGYHKPIPVNLDEQLSQFNDLKEYFKDFGDYAGISILFIIFQGMALIINGVGGSVYTGELSSYSVVIILFSIFSIAAVAHFGDLLCSELSKNQDELKSALAQFGFKGTTKVEEISNQVVSWEFKLTANNLFEINHSVILSTSNTILTYFIFVFQLKATGAEY